MVFIEDLKINVFVRFKAIFELNQSQVFLFVYQQLTYSKVYVIRPGHSTLLEFEKKVEMVV